MDFYQFHLNTKNLFQAGIARDFGNELSQLPAKRYLLVADPYFVQSGVAGEIAQGVETADFQIVGTFSDIPPNSEVKVVKACLQLAQAKQAEGLIVLGGGSAIDTAKAANIVLTLGGDLVEDHSGSQT